MGKRSRRESLPPPDRRVGSDGALVPAFGFSRRKDPRLPAGVFVWESADGLRVISSRVEAELPGSGGLAGPTWHVSVARLSQSERASDADLLRVVEAFGLPAWDEDNHHPGVARHLFCPIEERWRNECECKTDELVVVEPDGYRWTTPVEGGCRGCSFALMSGRPCPIHSPHNGSGSALPSGE